MKKTFLQYLKNQLSQKQTLISQNSITDEDKTLLNETIAELEAMIADIEAMDEEVNLDEVLAEFKNKIDEKITAIAEKINEQKEETIMTQENYLESRNSLKDFYTVVKNSSNNGEFMANWEAKLSENGISTADGGAEALLPAAIRGAIKDAWERPANFLNQLKNTGAKRYMVRTADATSDGSNRAKGHTKGNTKTAQDITLTPKDVKCQMIYKLLPVAAIDEFNDEGDLINYVVDELGRQWMAEIQRAILVGDGRQNSDTNKINSFEAIARSTTDAYVTVSTVDSDLTLLDNVVNMVSAIEDVDNDGIVLFVSKSTLNTLRRVVVADGGTSTYMSKEMVAEMLGVKEIFTTTMLGDTYTAIAFVPRGYVTVGFTSPELYSWIDGYKNETVYRMERPAGGAIEAPKSCAVLKAE